MLVQFGGVQQVSPPPVPALLTVLRTLTALCGVCHVLLADAVLVCLPVSARAGADPGLEAPTAQYLTAGRRWRHATGSETTQKKKKKRRETLWVCLFLTLWFPR